MNPKIPLTAIIVYSVILLLIYSWVIPNPLLLVDYIKNFDMTTVYAVMFLIILLESIVFLGFYFPWQFIAVLLVVTYAQWFSDIVTLTLISIVSVTLWAFINYYLWYFFFPNSKEKVTSISYKKMLASMIHITTIALFIFDQWSKKWPKKIIYLTWLLNFPYYLLIIGVTFYFKNEIMSVSENPYIIFVILLIWLSYSIFTNNKNKNA